MIRFASREGLAFLIRGPLRAPIAHIAEGVDMWPALDGEPATPLGGGRYAVRDAVITCESWRRLPSGPLDAGEFWPERWEPVLGRAAPAPGKAPPR